MCFDILAPWQLWLTKVAAKITVRLQPFFPRLFLLLCILVGKKTCQNIGQDRKKRKEKNREKTTEKKNETQEKTFIIQYQKTRRLRRRPRNAEERQPSSFEQRCVQKDFVLKNGFKT